MIAIKIQVEPHIAEYVHGKFFDFECGIIRFPPSLDIYILIYDLLQKRPKSNPVDTGNIEFALPERRLGKDPVTYNYLSSRSQKMLNKRLK